MKYFLGGQCSAFTASVGLDDAQTNRGSVVFTVRVDGRTVATSPVMRPTTATYALNANVTGGQFVELLVSNAGDDDGNDHADWADAKFACGEVVDPGGPTAPKGTAFVSDLPFLSESNGWGPVERDLSNGENAAGDGTPLTIGGVVYAKGLGTHANSSVEVYLGGQCTTFTAVLGLDDSKDEKGEGDVIFQVYGDGELLHDSGSITFDNPGTPLSVDVTGVEELRLAVDTNGVNYRDHANWADAKVTCAD